MARELTVALVGAGVVGAEFLRTMEERDFPVGELRLLATSRSAGRQFPFRDKQITVQETTYDVFDGADIVFVSASTEASKELCPVARDRGALAFDDSSAWRMQPDVPLVVPEINAEDLRAHKGIIATPNCSTVPLVQTLAPLMGEREVKRVIADTYQSVSGSGMSAMQTLRDQTAAALAGEPVTIADYPKQIAFNALPQVDVFQEDGYSKEEWKMLVESRKILHQPDLPMSATCVRVPTLISHAVSVHVELDRPLAPTEAIRLWDEQVGVEVLNGLADGEYPTPLDSAGKDPTFVGRVRQDTSHPNGLAYWCVTDNLRKGAALNMVQMVEWMLEDGCL